MAISVQFYNSDLLSDYYKVTKVHRYPTTSQITEALIAEISIVNHAQTPTFLHQIHQLQPQYLIKK